MVDFVTAGANQIISYAIIIQDYFSSRPILDIMDVKSWYIDKHTTIMYVSSTIDNFEVMVRFPNPSLKHIRPFLLKAEDLIVDYPYFTNMESNGDICKFTFSKNRNK